MDRLVWVDYSKGIGIFLVVLWHALTGLTDSGIIASSNPAPLVLRAIYAFHMPLFFFLSGLFAERALGLSLRRFLDAKTRTILYPYLLWPVLEITFKIAGSRYVNHPADYHEFVKILYAPIMQFWFLYALFVIVVAYGLLRRAGLPVWTIASIAIVLYIACASGLNLGEWGVTYQVCANAVYFVAGAFIGAVRLHDRWLTLCRNRSEIGAATGYGVIAVAVFASVERSPWLTPALSLIGIAATIGIGIALSNIRYLPHGLNWLRNEIQRWGSLSLQIFVAHTLFSATSRIAMQKLLGITHPFAHLTLGVLAGVYGPILIHHAAQRLNSRYLFIWPHRILAARYEPVFKS